MRNSVVWTNATSLYCLNIDIINKITDELLNENKYGKVYLYSSIPKWDSLISKTLLYTCIRISNTSKVVYINPLFNKKSIEKSISLISNNANTSNITILDNINYLDEIDKYLENNQDIKYVMIEYMNFYRLCEYSFNDIAKTIKTIAINKNVVIFVYFVMHRNIENNKNERSILDLDKSNLDSSIFDKVYLIYENKDNNKYIKNL